MAAVSGGLSRSAESPWFSRRLGLMDSHQGLVGPWCIVERGLKLGRRNVVEVAVQPTGVVPVHPSQGGQFDILDGFPGTGAGRSVDQFGFVVAIDRLHQRQTVPRHARPRHRTQQPRPIHPHPAHRRTTRHRRLTITRRFIVYRGSRSPRRAQHVQILPGRLPNRPRNSPHGPPWDHRPAEITDDRRYAHHPPGFHPRFHPVPRPTTAD